MSTAALVAPQISMKALLLRLQLLLAALVLIAACIPIPYKPSATVAVDSEIDMQPQFSIASEEDELAKNLAKRIQSEDQRITVISHRDIQAIAFPDGELLLENLMQSARLARLQQEFGLSYLVLVGDVTTAEIDRKGGFIPLLGAGTFKERTNLAAAVIDLTNGKIVSGISAITDGRTSGVVYGFWGLFLVPMNESSAYDGIAKGVVEVLRAKSGPGELKIAIAHVIGLAAQGCPDDTECQRTMPEPQSESSVQTTTPALDNER